MKISTKGRYGLRAVFELGLYYGEKSLSIKNISENQGISEHYLEQLFVGLRRAGIINSQRGAQGGYQLAKSPSEITVAEVLTVLEGPVDISECTIEGCKREGNCPTRIIWIKIRESVNNVINSITIQDMINDYKNNK